MPKLPDNNTPPVTVEHAAVADGTHTIDAADIELAENTEPRSRKGAAAPVANGIAIPEPPIEATAEQPVLTERDISAMADPRNASSPMATDGPGVREENSAPEHGSGAPIPWPFSN
jgi:hypothetical protein